MKFFALFSAVIAVALASPTTWTVHELSEAIENPNTHPSLVPILEDALNQLLYAVFTGSPQTVTTVSTVVQDFSAWTLAELSEALQDPATDPALVPYLEHGLNTMMENIMSGQNQEYIILGTPIGLLPIEQIVPVIIPEPVVVPAVPETPAASASPLVQIIVNIKSQESPIAPAPVVVDESPILGPSPVVVPSPVIVPNPVVVPSPPVVPNPIDIIAVNPWPVAPEVNPIDVIAILAPEVNPVDLISPVPVVVPVGAVDVVGPI